MKFLLGALLVASLSVPASAQSTLAVPGSFPSIQAAVDAAASGDTILVAPGHYNVSTISIVGKDLLVKSSHGARETELFVGTPGRCFFLSGTSTTGPQPMTIEGFTIENGRAPSGPFFPTGQDGESGGAILVDNGGLIVRGCTFQNNRAGDGSPGVTGSDGLTLTGGGTPGLPGGAGGSGGHGGAIAIFQNGGFGSPSSIESCQFIDNRTGSGGFGGDGGDGGDDIGSFFGFDDPGGKGGQGGIGGEGGSGGAIFHAAGTALSITNCAMTQGKLGAPGAAGSPGSGGEGNPDGQDGAPGLAGFPGKGGGIATTFGATTVLHCTLYFNDGVGFFSPPPGAFAPSFFQNSIAYSNSATVDIAAGIVAAFSNIQGGAGGTNIDAPPQFTLTAIGDLHLSATSPCVDAGSVALTGSLALDLDGDERILGGLPDMGSDEDYDLVGSDEGLLLLLSVGSNALTSRRPSTSKPATS